MKIIGLNIENIKKIKALELHPDGNTVIVTGANAQGKSTVLDSISMALTGKVSDDPISHGKDRGEVKVDLGDYIITKTFTRAKGGVYLKVENADGAKFSSPQALLDQLINDNSIDPLEFAGLKTKDQRETLLRLIGVDLDPLERSKKALYDERVIVGREGKALRGKFDLMPHYEDAPEQLVDIRELYRQIDEEKQKELTSRRLQESIDNNFRTIEASEQEIIELEEQIKALRNNIDAMQQGIRSMEAECSELSWDYDLLEERLEHAEDDNKKVAANRDKKRAEEELEAKRKEYDDLTAKIDAVDKKKVDMLNAANLPIEGLSIDEDGVLYNGCRFSELSSAEQLRVSLAIAIRMNPKLRVISIKDGSLLDSKSLQIIEEMAKGNDYQVWIERVDETGKVGIYIEDGAVVSVDGLPVQQKSA